MLLLYKNTTIGFVGCDKGTITVKVSPIYTKIMNTNTQLYIICTYIIYIYGLPWWLGGKESTYQ